MPVRFARTTTPGTQRSSSQPTSQRRLRGCPILRACCEGWVLCDKSPQKARSAAPLKVCRARRLRVAQAFLPARLSPPAANSDARWPSDHAPSAQKAGHSERSGGLLLHSVPTWSGRPPRSRGISLRVFACAGGAGFPTLRACCEGWVLCDKSPHKRDQQRPSKFPARDAFKHHSHSCLCATENKKGAANAAPFGQDPPIKDWRSQWKPYFFNS